MYAGRIIEYGPTEKVLLKPEHPYTAGLIESLCTLESKVSDNLRSIPGNPPKPDNIPLGCSFHPRCWIREKKCEIKIPQKFSSDTNNEFFSECHRASEIYEGLLALTN